MSFSARLKSNLSRVGFLIICLSVIFFVAEFIFFSLSSEIKLSTMVEADTAIFVTYLHTPKLMFGLVFFIFAFIGLRVLFVAMIYWISRLVAYVLKLTKRDHLIVTVLIWVLAVMSILLLNNYLFPLSKFSFWHYDVDSVVYVASVAFCVAGIFLVFCAIAACGIVKWFIEKKYWFGLFGTFAAIIVLLAFDYFGFFATKMLPVTNAERPNIIIIGIDSLRPDFVTAISGRTIPAGPFQKVLTPNIDRILKGATIFANSYTPLAHTYPSWMSILSGNFPDQNGAIYNLAPRGDNKELLPYDLKKLGYYGVVSFDENRFSNFDTRYGYDQVIGPFQGANDFILGSFNDFPLTNLIINTSLGRWFFPYQYANRADATTYYPSTFSNLLQGKLATIQNRPLFLAVHFCLPHWPYYWAINDPLYGPYFHGRDTDLVYAYEQGVLRVDKQVGMLWNQLEQQGVLKHAIVIVLSDHGESLLNFDPNLMPADKFVREKTRPKNLIWILPPWPVFGHGPDLNTLVENHNLLAFKLMGYSKNFAKTVKQRVSLIDVRPTILSLLNQPLPKTAGISLKKAITLPGNNLIPDSPIFMETGLMIVQLKDQHIPVSSLIIRGLNYYEIDKKTGLIQMNAKNFDELKKNKFRAVMYKDWYLIMVPNTYLADVKNDDSVRSILYNMKTGRWTDDLSSKFARTAPLMQMIGLLRKVYGNGIGANIVGVNSQH